MYVTYVSNIYCRLLLHIYSTQNNAIHCTKTPLQPTCQHRRARGVIAGGGGLRLPCLTVFVIIIILIIIVIIITILIIIITVIKEK
jgi:hypothetical protein